MTGVVPGTAAGGAGEGTGAGAAATGEAAGGAAVAAGAAAAAAGAAAGAAPAGAAAGASTGDGAGAGAAAAAAAAAGASAAAGAAADKPGVWPENWRQQIAGEDKGRLTQLERFADPAAIFKQNLELQAKLSSGTVKTALPDNATDEQKATWRKENGLPENADGYVGLLALPNGQVFGEADKPVISALASVALETNIPPAAFKGVVAKYYELQDQAVKARADADVAFHDESVSALTTEWGDAEYRRNKNIIGNLMSAAPAGVADKLLAGRTADGKMIGDDPGVLKWLADLGRQIVPISTMIQPSADVAKANSTRMAEISRLMGDRGSEYWRGPTAAALQQEYRDLVAASQGPQGR